MDERINRCHECNIDMPGSRKDAKFCSPRCRKDASRKRVTLNENVTLKTPEAVTLNFEFKTKDIRSDTGFHVDTAGKDIIRKAKYWYDVPLGAVPILKKDWPEMPGYMNGREYFLWWKNNFEIRDDRPVIINPYPNHETVKYEMGGAQSRRWGA